MIVRQGKSAYNKAKRRYFQEPKVKARNENRSPASDELWELWELCFVLYGEYGMQLGLASI
jgi:hypothetical protein